MGWARARGRQGRGERARGVGVRAGWACARGRRGHDGRARGGGGAEVGERGRCWRWPGAKGCVARGKTGRSSGLAYQERIF